MAQQCGPLFFECTWDDLTFYKMGKRYFVRKKSRLTREKVLTHPCFANTRLHANTLAVASKIASSIYSDLPIGWRQFWMYRDFTGEAMTMLNNGATAQTAYDHLWNTYVEYWVRYQQATGIQLKTGRKQQPVKRGRDYKTRLKHRTGNPKRRRYRRLIGRNHWKSTFDNTPELREKERKCIAYKQKLAWLEEQKRPTPQSARRKALVQNAMKHNMVSREQPLEVSIRCTGTGMLVIENKVQKKREPGTIEWCGTGEYQ